ncbi:MAG: hypothetical protein R3E84_15915 [Pseudomonadales bacterium]
MAVTAVIEELMIRVKNSTILSAGLSPARHGRIRIRNNINHWHNNDNGGGQETSIYVEEYPDGTTYVNQDGHRYVWPAKGGDWIVTAQWRVAPKRSGKARYPVSPMKTKLPQEGDSRSARTIN